MGWKFDIPHSIIYKNAKVHEILSFLYGNNLFVAIILNRIILTFYSQTGLKKFNTSHFVI